MSSCPHCRKPLQTIRQREGVFHYCPDCHGRAVSIPQLRRITGDAFAVRLLRFLKATSAKGKQPCPFCDTSMHLLTCPEPPLDLAGCRACAILWIDLEMFSHLPEGAAENTGTLQMLSTEILAARRLKELQEKEKADQEAERKRKSLGNSLKVIFDQK
jgi:Zn-finger nucleic acid-binding protein